jgi:hypothetical protein
MTDPLQQQLRDVLGVAYTITRELSGGGMSRVFLAEEVALNRRVVVKVLAPKTAAAAATAQRPHERPRQSCASRISSRSPVSLGNRDSPVTASGLEPSDKEPPDSEVRSCKLL